MLHQLRLSADDAVCIGAVAHADHTGHHRLCNVCKRARYALKRLDVLTLRIDSPDAFAVLHDPKNGSAQQKSKRCRLMFSIHTLTPKLILSG